VSLKAACRGVEAIVSTATAVTSGGDGNTLDAVDGDGYASLLQAARGAGVRRFVHVSASPKYGESSPLVLHKRATERLVRASGLDYVILQPSFFMDIWFSPALGWDLKAGKAQIFGAGDAPISFIAVGDVAAYAVAMLEALGVKNQVIPLGGPEALTPRRALQVIEQATGKKFKVTTLPGFVPTLASRVLKPFNPKLASLMGLGAETLTGDAIDPAAARAFGAAPATTLAEWVRRET
jgi:NADH dehydrogenase